MRTLGIKLMCAGVATWAAAAVGKLVAPEAHWIIAVAVCLSAFAGGWLVAALTTAKQGPLNDPDKLKPGSM